MKIIDLLNKIANGEEVPKKIKYRKCIFEYEEKYKDYFTKNGIIPATFDTNGLFRNIFLDYNNCLNDEVEIIEEDKKIEKIKQRKKIEGSLEGKTYYSWKYDVEDIGNKINELIDEINKLKEKQ